MYDIKSQSKGQLLLHIRKFLLYPPYWGEPNNQISIPLTWHCVKLEAASRNNVPQESGLYCFVLSPTFQNFVESKYIMYIGKTNRTLRQRFGEYIAEQEGKGKPRDKIENMLNLYKGHLSFYFCSIPDSNSVDAFEEKLLNVFVPFVNTSIPNAIIKPELKNIYANG